MLMPSMDKEEIQVIAIYARREESAKKFATDYQCSIWSTNMEEIIAHKDVNMICIFFTE